MSNKTQYKAIAFTQGKHIPSARFRIKNLSERLRQLGVNLTINDARKSSYPPKQKFLRPIWFATEFLSRIPGILSSKNYDIVILERELISTIATLERFTKGPRILDVDDAIWFHRGGLAADALANISDHIVCGNSYIADYFSRFGKKISIIPTAVDTKKFTPRTSPEPTKIIGWSGTAGGLKFVYSIEKPLKKILDQNPSWKLRIVSNQPPKFKLIPQEQFEFIQWTEENEVETIATMDIGLMPLDDTPWSRGKCSYKMLLYMACGLPVVVSDFGMNREVLDHDFVGYGASNEQDWFEHITDLIKDKDLCKIAGSNGRKIIEEHYSIEIAASKWVEVISSVVSRKNQ